LTKTTNRGGEEKEAAAPVLDHASQKGRDQKTISKNIGTLIAEGYPRDQAAAIAHDHARWSNKGKKK